MPASCVEDAPDVTVRAPRTGLYLRRWGTLRDVSGRLTRWAGPRDLLALPGAGMLTVYHDDPELTHRRLRIGVCLAVPEGTPVDGKVGSMVGVEWLRLGRGLSCPATWSYIRQAAAGAAATAAR